MSYAEYVFIDLPQKGYKSSHNQSSWMILSKDVCKGKKEFFIALVWNLCYLSKIMEQCSKNNMQRKKIGKGARLIMSYTIGANQQEKICEYRHILTSYGTVLTFEY